MSDLLSSKASTPISSVLDIAHHEVDVKPALNVVQTVGSTLLAARLSNSWTVQQVADQLKLSTKQIIALEANSFDALPKMVIVRGFVRAYAKLLKINADAVVLLLPNDQNDVLQVPLRAAHSIPFLESRSSIMGRHDNKKYWIGSGLLFICAIGFYLFQTYELSLSTKKLLASLTNSENIVTPNSSLDIKPTSNPGSSVAEADKLLLGKELVIENISSSASTSALVVSTSASAVKESKAPLEVVNNVELQNQTLDEFVLHFRQDSWLQIKRENGTVVTSHLARAGTDEKFKLTEPLVVRIGNAAGVDAFLRGASLPIVAENGTNVININVK